MTNKLLSRQPRSVQTAYIKEARLRVRAARAAYDEANSDNINDAERLVLWDNLTSATLAGLNFALEALANEHAHHQAREARK